MSTIINLPIMNDEDALSYLIAHLRGVKSNNTSAYERSRRISFSIEDVIVRYLNEIADKQIKAQPQQGISYQSLNNRDNTEPFYCAASNLCSRGILAPKPIQNIATAFTFCLTDYGNAWLDQTQPEVCLPTEYARFAQLLRSHAKHFGDGYQFRSQEALKCYEAHVFYACCAMCGAAAESILLATAIEKKGSEDEILKDYKSANGRKKIEDYLIGRQTQQIKDDFTNYMSPLKYWRDESAHGASKNIQEEEAFTSLLVLLRFAQFADNRWAELTT